jgi:tryptophan synthase alpha chain
MMGYLNPIIQFGFENYCREAVRCGIDGFIIPDLPFAEYMETYKPIADEYGIHIIMLITPETSEERIRMIDQHTSGFIYMVSSASVTGAKDRFSDESLAYFRRVNAMHLQNPRLIGFGISNKETFNAACREASGAIIGSKFISLLGSEKSIEEAAKKLMDELR